LSVDLLELRGIAGLVEPSGRLAGPDRERLGQEFREQN
jgi:hypothetical protein